ncbi:hypothetical protein [Paraburkholderia sediminicola]|uniref:hypothetical protein n=1 Tax=Paraburkholderia sediminicola TaxID=458836 RepID=UPI0038BD100E
MTAITHGLTQLQVSALATQHSWAATGVSDYPPRDPLVGQSRFFKRYRTFIQTVDSEADSFAHVFALEGEWGRGKSRLGYELIAQVNDCSNGWFVRNAQGQLEEQKLFDQAEQDKYLALYIRYSQVATEYQNSDNWFGYGLYKALLPLALKHFDGSIQSRVAEQALNRLVPMGFDAEQLATALEIDRAHSDEALYEQTGLVVRLVQAAYDYLKKFGIAYVLVVLDELETVAEAATFGLENDDAQRLDGQAIRLIGRAIKEEDPRRRLPWLRYVALCSPLLGQQLREIQSVERRVELVELEHSAFADVSDYVQQVKASGRLPHEYSVGLVEAAYAMSGGNFGWFNVVMANVDAVLTQFASAGKATPSIGQLFDAVVESSSRMAKHVLDREALNGVKTNDHSLRDLACGLIYGQLPQPLAAYQARLKELIALQNEDGDPVVTLYRKLPLTSLQCRQALEEAKFNRKGDDWMYAAVDQSLSLEALVNNLRTFAVNEAASDVMLMPLARGEFKQMLSLVYDHPAIEFAADALWHKLVGSEVQLPESEATHVGPSVAMLLRLDLRYRGQQQNTLVFRDPAHAASHEMAMRQFAKDAGGNAPLRYQVRLTGLCRVLDRHWAYGRAAYQNGEGLTIQLPMQRPAGGSGLLNFDDLKLHPDGLAWFAWVSNFDELDKLHALAAARSQSDGRMPVMAFTASAHLMEQYDRLDLDARLRDVVCLYKLSPSEIDLVERVGLTEGYVSGFVFDEATLTTRFKSKLNALRDFAYQSARRWRQRLNQRGLIAWPMRAQGRLSITDRDLLFKAWTLFVVEQPQLQGLHQLKPEHGVDAADLSALLTRLTPSPRAASQGYSPEEHAGFFSHLQDPQHAMPQVPPFLAAIGTPTSSQEWTLEKAKRDWYWGYLWQPGMSGAKSVFDDWMWWCAGLNLLKLEQKPGQTTAGKWVNVPRAALDNAINEAKNWFEGQGASDYPATVAVLERVFGEDKIPGLFAPMNKAPNGTETVLAYEYLRRARTRYEQLKVAEEAMVAQQSVFKLVAAMPTLLQSRFVVLADVARVLPSPRPIVALQNIHTLQLENKEQSLYERIEQARMFAEKVEQSGKRINQRVQALIQDISAEAAAMPQFPVALYTLSLETVAKILQGALEKKDDSATAKAESQSSSETLLFFLRSLQLDKASERLELLAEEAGVDLDTGAVRAQAEVQGYILSSYQKAKQKFLEERVRLNAQIQRAKSLKAQLDPLPDDFPIAGLPKTVEDILQKLVFVADAFDDLADQGKTERARFAEQARKGQFKAIEDVHQRLFHPVSSQLHVQGGELIKAANGVHAYQSDRLAYFNERLPLLNPLYAATGQAQAAPLHLGDIEALSLHDLGIELALRQQKLEAAAETALAGTGLDVAEWVMVAQAIRSGVPCTLPAAAQDELVEKGVLKVQLAFGSDA